MIECRWNETDCHTYLCHTAECQLSANCCHAPGTKHHDDAMVILHEHAQLD